MQLFSLQVSIQTISNPYSNKITLKPSSQTFLKYYMILWQKQYPTALLAQTIFLMITKKVKRLMAVSTNYFRYYFTTFNLALLASLNKMLQLYFHRLQVFSIYQNNPYLKSWKSANLSSQIIQDNKNIANSSIILSK